MIKRILAIIGIILLVTMYALTLIFSLSNNTVANELLGASIAATIVIPVLLWVGILFFNGRNENKKTLEKKEDMR